MHTFTRTVAAAGLVAAATVGSLGIGAGAASAAEPQTAGKTQLIFQYYDQQWGSVSKAQGSGGTLTMFLDHMAPTEAAVAKTAPFWDVVPTSGGWATLQLRGDCLGTAPGGPQLAPVACDGSSAQEWRLGKGGLERRANGVVYGKAGLTTQGGTSPTFRIGAIAGTGALGGDHEGLQPAAVTLTSPGIGEEITDTKPVFTGTGHPGSTVVVDTRDGVRLGSGTVGEDGTWSIRSQVGLTPGYQGGTVTQTAYTGATTTAEYHFVLASIAG